MSLLFVTAHLLLLATISNCDLKILCTERISILRTDLSVMKNVRFCVCVCEHCRPIGIPDVQANYCFCHLDHLDSPCSRQQLWAAQQTLLPELDVVGRDSFHFLHCSFLFCMLLHQTGVFLRFIYSSFAASEISIVCYVTTAHFNLFKWDCVW